MVIFYVCHAWDYQGKLYTGNQMVEEKSVDPKTHGDERLQRTYSRRIWCWRTSRQELKIEVLGETSLPSYGPPEA